ncbi:MAG: TetR/AcrR family transcriptional regulator [Halothermotrichaceae bacterium]
MRTSEVYNHIEKKLINKSSELFLKKGFKDTSVSEITERAGIATGTFYNYFSSKEELFLIIFIEENNKLKKEIMADLDFEGNTVEIIKYLVYKFLYGMQENIVLREFFNQNTFNKIEKKTNFKKEDYGEVAYELFIPVIKKWQARGRIKEKDPQYIIAFFDAILYVYLHKEDIGSKFFPQLMDDLIKYIVNGLRED